MIIRLAFLCLAVALISPIQFARAEVRVLVMASNYDLIDTDPELLLANPIADADLIVSAMEKGRLRNVTLIKEPQVEDWEDGFNRFVASLAPDDVAMLYYAGHGFQIEGRNYFLASDGVSLIPLDHLVQKMTEKAQGAIIVVDACRNNPLADKDGQTTLGIRTITGAHRSIDTETITLNDIKKAGPGLAQLGNLRGLSAVVLFSTEPGNVAEDGDKPGKGSPFAKALAKEIKKRQSLDEMMRKTAIKVNRKTDGRQSPWRQGDLPFDVFLAGMRALPIP
ncbi:MAG: caspase family protein [Parasphingorhabdus sp.]|uniref:caspase family protein n=1 Tax=Parasphingorhabdus sp. TaxID=2709688 RepID=UPI003296A7AA